MWMVAAFMVARNERIEAIGSVACVDSDSTSARVF